MGISRNFNNIYEFYKIASLKMKLVFTTTADDSIKQFGIKIASSAIIDDNRQASLALRTYSDVLKSSVKLLI